MMNPSVYLREAKRIESETPPRIHHVKQQRPVATRNRGYIREQLSSGCILYRMNGLSSCAIRRESQ